MKTEKKPVFSKLFFKINVMKSKSDNVVNQNGSTHTRISEIIGMGSDVMTHF